MLLSSKGVEEEIKRKFFLMSETNENGNTIYQNLWGAAKAGLRSS